MADRVVPDAAVEAAWGAYSHPGDDEPESAEIEAMRVALTAALSVMARDPEVRERIARALREEWARPGSADRWSRMADAVLSVLGEQEGRCEACDGSGERRESRFGSPPVHPPCPSCSGSGRVLSGEGDEQR